MTWDLYDLMRSERNSNRLSQATTWPVNKRDTALVAVDDLPRNRQSQAGARRRRTGRINAEEWLECSRQKLFGDARAIIDNVDEYGFAIAAHTDSCPPTVRCSVDQKVANGAFQRKRLSRHLNEQTANFGDGSFQAAFLLASSLFILATSSPSTNFTPVISFGN